MRSLIDLCKGRYPVGLFSFDKELWTDAGVKQAADCGADFFMSVDSLEPLVGLCEKYNMGIISSSNMPLWWGGDGDNAGGYAAHFPVEKLDEIKKVYPSSPAVWGDYPVDEPNSKDFAHINKVMKRYKELFPGKIPFINLYPNYASVPKNTAEETVSQLGNPTYREHIEQYVREIDLPYISFDFYPYTNPNVFAKYLENLDIVAGACKKSNREMWVIIQTGAWKAEEIIDAYQLDWQVYMCLAYGASAIIHAGYSKVWWDETTSCVNLKGEKNLTYEYVKDINSKLHSLLGTEFLKYNYLYTTTNGDIDSSDERIRPQLKYQLNSKKPDITEISNMPEIKINSDKAVTAGYFKKDNDFAVMLVNSHNPFDGSVTANIKIEAPQGRQINICGNKKISAAGKTTGGVRAVDLVLASGQGAFVTF
ncbi:MAG: hypothetical protein FWH24_00280 [Oscillospiraceae bacterium]|nr:hypothetical protein [Oscillospiraceae bacterium]